MSRIGTPLRLQDHEIAEARRLLAALRDLSNPLPSFLYDRYLAPAIDDLESEVWEYEESLAAVREQEVIRLGGAVLNVTGMSNSEAAEAVLDAMNNRCAICGGERDDYQHAMAPWTPGPAHHRFAKKEASK